MSIFSPVGSWSPNGMRRCVCVCVQNVGMSTCQYIPKRWHVHISVHFILCQTTHTHTHTHARTHERTNARTHTNTHTHTHRHTHTHTRARTRTLTHESTRARTQCTHTNTHFLIPSEDSQRTGTQVDITRKTPCKTNTHPVQYELRSLLSQTPQTESNILSDARGG